MMLYMIRTRDILIFVAVLFFLGVGIAWTVSQDIRFSGAGEGLERIVAFNDASTTYEAVRTEDERDRQGLIDHLRNMLASNDIDIVPQPSVEEEGVEEQASTTDDADIDDSQTLMSCGGDDAADASRNWPLAGVSLQAAGSVRQAVFTPVAGASSEQASSSTQASSEAKILIQMPVTPAKTAEPSCVGSVIVGVSVTGSLMYNNEASFYRGFGSEYLIGYARDGFPIYGYYEGQVDACGGYDHPSGYRYTVTPDNDHLLNCFSGQPAPFLPI